MPFEQAGFIRYREIQARATTFGTSLQDCLVIVSGSARAINAAIHACHLLNLDMTIITDTPCKTEHITCICQYERRQEKNNNDSG